jgi:hypothetical protein
MIAEGSVVAATGEPVGAAVNVAPDGFEHPVYRSGLALALKLPEAAEMAEAGPVEVPVEGDLEQRPCEEARSTEFEELREEGEPSSEEEPLREEEPGAEEMRAQEEESVRTEELIADEAFTPEETPVDDEPGGEGTGEDV